MPHAVAHYRPPVWADGTAAERVRKRRKAAGEPELSVGGDDQPGPPVSGGWIAQLGPGPAEDLLEEPERVFDIKASQECLPGAVDRVSG